MGDRTLAEGRRASRRMWWPFVLLAGPTLMALHRLETGTEAAAAHAESWGPLVVHGAADAVHFFSMALAAIAIRAHFGPDWKVPVAVNLLLTYLWGAVIVGLLAGDALRAGELAFAVLAAAVCFVLAAALTRQAPAGSLAPRT